MAAPFPQEIKVKFTAKQWNEVPFHELAGAGKLSRATIVNLISGDLEGEGVLEYLLCYPNQAGGPVPFIGYERFVGKMGALEGAFTLKHDGTFSPAEGVYGSLEVLNGTGDFDGIRGKGTISAKPGEHGGEYTVILERRG